MDMSPIDDDNDFAIRHSQKGALRQIAITPDAATCKDCLAELDDPNDRRFRYPFINCTNCGPRYTITFDVPYDRPNTTMGVFNMCPQCQAEYENPADRRFHAQPNACPVCGPKVWLTDANGKEIESQNPITDTIKLLQQENIVAIKGLGGFHLAVRADSDKALAELRKRKYRKAKAFAVMVRDIDTAKQFAHISDEAEKLLISIERPIVLCPKKDIAPLSPAVAPASRFFGIMLPYTPLHTMLMAGDFCALVMTSGNNSDEPIESTNAGALEKLGQIADYFLMHDREIYTSCDDSVVKVFKGEPLILRKARGYVPTPITVHRRCDSDILAVGAELKNTVTYFKDDKAFVSQHIGDLEGTATYDSFVRTIEKLGALTGARPEVIACDLHPAMLSTRFAESYHGVEIVCVQHHHAHIAAVMGEHHLDGPVIGLSADGVGYGADGTVWGCELMTVWPSHYDRNGCLENVLMPGGDAASKNPWRMAASYLVHTFGPNQGLQIARELLGNINAAEIDVIGQMIKSGINSPECSSLGRFFDAVSALVGLCRQNTYEAQAAIELETSVDINIKDCYPAEIMQNAGFKTLMVKPIIQAIVQDLRAGVEKEIIAAKFHNFVVAGLTNMAAELAGELDINIVALSGGVFQNDLILTRLIQALQSRGLRVYFNQALPVNDGAVSFGQAVVADAVIAEKLNKIKD